MPATWVITNYILAFNVVFVDKAGKPLMRTKVIGF